MFDSNAHERNVDYWYKGRADDYVNFNRDVVPARRG